LKFEMEYRRLLSWCLKWQSPSTVQKRLCLCTVVSAWLQVDSRYNVSFVVMLLIFQCWLSSDKYVASISGCQNQQTDNNKHSESEKVYGKAICRWPTENEKECGVVGSIISLQSGKFDVYAVITIHHIIKIFLLLLGWYGDTRVKDSINQPILSHQSS
jgi:hypothetical protein